MGTHVRTSVIADGTVAHIQLHRPEKLNALTGLMYGEIEAALDEAHADSRVNAILLSGAGRSFCAGFDLAESAGSTNESAWEQWQAIEHNRLILTKLWESPQPTVAAVQGHCLGGGFALANHADFIVAADDAIFGEPEILYSLMPSARLASFVPPRIATELLLLGRDFSAELACQIGLVNRMVPAERLLETAGELASELARRPPEIVAMAKRSLIQAHNLRGMAAVEESDWRSFLLSKSMATGARKEFNDALAAKGTSAALHQLRESIHEKGASVRSGATE